MAGPTFNKINKKSKPFKKNRLNLVFDEEKRREFLTGFHKRKLQRKKKAQDKLKEDLKSERKRLKAEARDSYKKLVVSHRTIPELETLFKDEYEEDDVTVKVLELSTNTLADQSQFIGSNNAQYVTKTEATVSDNKEDRVPGMNLNDEDGETENPESQTFNSERDVKKLLKKQAAKKVKKSKVFQRKNKIEKQKQRKKSMVMKKQRLKEKDKKKQKN